MTNPDTDAERIEAIRERVEKATEGPWRQCQADGDDCQCGLVWSKPVDVPVAKALNDSSRSVVASVSEDAARANMKLIGHARSDIPFLLDLLDDAADDIDQALDQLHGVTGTPSTEMAQAENRLRHALTRIQEGRDAE